MLSYTSLSCTNIQAIEMGVTTLLVDEDTCATNFMIRDEKMMRLVAKDKEPITPFVQKVINVQIMRNVDIIRLNVSYISPSYKLDSSII